MTVVTRKTDYATRVLLHLALRPVHHWTTSREVAEIQGIPERLVGSVVSQLAKAGLVETKRGKGGGIRLGIPSSRITMLDVVRVMQGPIQLNTCLSSTDSCNLSDACSMKNSWAHTQDILDEELRSTTFEDLAEAGESTPEW